MEIVFFGTGGGRFNLIKQVRGTGGFRIDSKSANIHVDPGPGALVRSVQMNYDPLKLDAVIVSHNHIDHSSDAMVLVEGMTQHTLKKRGIIIGSKEVLVGGEAFDKAIDRYHQKLAKTLCIAKSRERKRFTSEKGSFEIEFYAMDHEEPSTFGFKLFLDGKIVGYISDTKFTDSLGVDFSHCDILIVNCMKPQQDKYAGHLTTADTIELLKVAKPALCLLTHLGMQMIEQGPEMEALKIEKETGVKTVAAVDRMKLKV